MEAKTAQWSLKKPMVEKDRKQTLRPGTFGLPSWTIWLILGAMLAPIGFERGPKIAPFWHKIE